MISRLDKFSDLMLDFLPNEYDGKATFVGQKMFVEIAPKVHAIFSLCWTGGIGIWHSENTLKISTNLDGVDPVFLCFNDYFARQLWRPSRNDEAYCPMFLVDTESMTWSRVKPTETDLKLFRKTIENYLDIVKASI